MGRGSRTLLALWASAALQLGAQSPGAVAKVNEVMAVLSTAATEQERGALLAGLEAPLREEAALKAELAILLQQHREWLGLAEWIHTVKETVDGDGPPWQVPEGEDALGIQPGSPFYDLARFYEARNLIWYAIEGTDDPKVDKRCMERARKWLLALAERWPRNETIKGYLGTSVQPPAKTYDRATAPDWAALQREGLERMTDVIEWWVDHRQRPDKSYGGGWGDDCEMWRWWVPVLLTFEEPKVEKAQIAFSEALLGQPYLASGYYSRKLTDVEHSAEDLSDAMAPLMHLAPQDPRWKDKSLRLIQLMQDLWTGRNQKGQLQFKSTFFSGTEVSQDPKQACDTVYHPRAIQPALIYWQRTGDPAIGKLVLDWVKTWVEAARGTENGKPAGIIPSALHWPEGRPGGVEGIWWHPGNYVEDDLYDWPSAMEYMLDLMLLCHAISRDPAYLEPIRSMAQVRRDYLKKPTEQELPPGTREWCGQQMDFLDNVLPKLAVMTGTREFDDILEEDGGSYNEFRRSGSTRELEKSLLATAQSFRRYSDFFTTEVRWTDRVLYFPRIFSKKPMLFEKKVANQPRPEPGVLYSMASGDPGSPGYCPLAAVRWHTSARNIAALVTKATETAFAAKLYHFGAEPRTFDMELFRLRPGRYRLDLGRQRTEVVIDAQHTRVPITLPSRKLVEVTLAPI